MGKPSSAQLLVTCLVEAIRPAVGLATARLLERLGLHVSFPEGQTCCGQPAFNAGEWDDARAMARHTVDVFVTSEAPVVIPSGSCADMVIHRYPELLANDDTYGPRARSLAARAFELSAFLTDVMKVEDVGAKGGGVSLAYHPSCHLLRGLGISGGPERLLRSVEGVELRSLHGAEECCGFGGLFSVKMADISGAMLSRKLDAVERSGASAVVACDLSCLLQIEGGLRRRGVPVAARHLAEVLEES
jgi:L-lactate dehydrogenase complex protein LldE